MMQSNHFICYSIVQYDKSLTPIIYKVILSVEQSFFLDGVAQ